MPGKNQVKTEILKDFGDLVMISSIKSNLKIYNSSHKNIILQQKIILCTWLVPTDTGVIIIVM